MKTLIAIPTYNEKDNIRPLVEGLRNYFPNTTILFIDDSSPDGTAQAIKEIKEELGPIWLWNRLIERGVGGAHLFAIQYGYAKGVEELITLDADLTHSPEEVWKLYNNKGTAAVCMGNRFDKEGGFNGWDRKRITMSKLAHFLVKRGLKTPLDVSGGLRIYHLPQIPEELWSEIKSIDFSFFMESAVTLYRNKLSIKTIPITLMARHKGESKLKWKHIAKWFKMYFRLLKQRH